MKRLFDFFLGVAALLALLPVFVIVSFFIVLDNGFPVFFIQKRVGKNQKEFGLLKFRSMRKLRKDETEMQITVGQNKRITKVGSFIRRYKIDELPQLINIVKGDMSFVGPRPEVPKYVSMYNDDQLKVLSVRPGLTDYASIKYKDESELLAKSDDPERLYIEKVMPDKLAMNLNYVANQSFWMDLKIIRDTFKAILSK